MKKKKTETGRKELRGALGMGVALVTLVLAKLLSYVVGLINLLNSSFVVDSVKARAKKKRKTEKEINRSAIK